VAARKRIEPVIVCAGHTAPHECSWCGADIGAEMLAGTTDRPYRNRAGEVFCRRFHREESNRARKRFVNAVAGIDPAASKKLIRAMRAAWGGGE